MNIALNANMVDIDSCIKFLDTKNNNIMDGKFTKFLYSDEYASFNGLYVVCPLTRFVTNSFYKNNFTFNVNNPNNQPIIQHLIQFEKQLIHLYKQYSTCNKKHVFSLENQLYTGSIKVYHDNIVKGIKQHGTFHNEMTKNSFHDDLTICSLNKSVSRQSFYIIKISGIWETSDTIGITYKFLEMYR